MLTEVFFKIGRTPIEEIARDYTITKMVTCCMKAFFKNDAFGLPQSLLLPVFRFHVEKIRDSFFFPDKRLEDQDVLVFFANALLHLLNLCDHLGFPGTRIGSCQCLQQKVQGFNKS